MRERDMPTYETGRWKHGDLAAAVLGAHGRTMGGTPAQIAKMIGSRPDRVRATGRRLGLTFAKGRDVPVEWTAEMKHALLECAIANTAINTAAEHLGVSSVALVRGLFEIVRDLARRDGG